MKKILLLLCLLTLNTISFAARTSDIVVLTYGSMDPKQSLTIKLNELAPHVNYDVICENINTNMSADIDVYYRGGSNAKLNDDLQTHNVFTLKKDHYASGYKLTFENVNTDSWTAIELTNLDNSARVNLHNCVAKVQH